MFDSLTGVVTDLDRTEFQNETVIDFHITERASEFNGTLSNIVFGPHGRVSEMTIRLEPVSRQIEGFSESETALEVEREVEALVNDLDILEQVRERQRELPIRVNLSTRAGDEFWLPHVRIDPGENVVFDDDEFVTFVGQLVRSYQHDKQATFEIARAMPDSIQTDTPPEEPSDPVRSFDPLVDYGEGDAVKVRFVNTHTRDDDSLEGVIDEIRFIEERAGRESRSITLTSGDVVLATFDKGTGEITGGSVRVNGRRRGSLSSIEKLFD